MNDSLGNAVPLTGWKRLNCVADARAAERNCRRMGLYETAVRWQQYADAIAARGEVYMCEMAHRGERLGRDVADGFEAWNRRAK